MPPPPLNREHPKKLLTEAQRNCLLISYYQARCELGLKDASPELLTSELFEAFLDGMEQFRHLHQLSRSEMPTSRSIRNLLASFNKTGTATPGKFSGRKRAFDESFREKACEVLQSNPLERARSVLIEEFGKAPSKVHLSRIGKESGLRSYQPTPQQHLTDLAKARRNQFAHYMHDRLIAYKEIDLKHIIFSDEKMFLVGTRLHRQNDRRWRMKGDNLGSDLAIDRVHHPKYLHVWASMNQVLGIIGPYFVDDTRIDR